MDSIYFKLRLQMENIILVGMPGSGKTTVGMQLAKKLGKTFVDTDAAIIDFAGMSIPEIFSISGEEGFRQLETSILSQLGKKSGLIIATGGGCITKEENYRHLHQNGRIIWLQRDIELLPTSGRPLSQAGSLSDMFRIRKPMYERFSDLIVCNDSTPEQTVCQILKLEESV